MVVGSARESSTVPPCRDDDDNDDDAMACAYQLAVGVCVAFLLLSGCARRTLKPGFKRRFRGHMLVEKRVRAMTVNEDKGRFL